VREKVGNWLRFLLTIEWGFQEGSWKGKIIWRQVNHVVLIFNPWVNHIIIIFI
jgi:hypothetical protein